MSDAANIANMAVMHPQMGSVFDIVAVGARVAAVVFLFRAIVHFRKVHVGREEVSMSYAFVCLAVSASLWGFPSFMQAIPDIMFGGAGSSAQTAPADAEAPHFAPAMEAAAVQSTPSAALQAPALDPLLVKEPSHGGSGDLQALLEILALFSSLALGGWWAVSKAAKRGQERREIAQAAIAELTMLEAPSSSAAGDLGTPAR